MMRQWIAVSLAAMILLGMMASLGVSGAAEYKAMNQTIPGAVGVYLPIVMQQVLPTPTPTFMATVTPTATVSPTVTATVTPTPTSGATCHAAYPTVCIPPPPPDLDCRNIPYRRFTVLPPDPHNFDSDHDGIGCES